MTPEILVGGAILGALVLYAVTGGADFGGGVWDLLASGRTRKQQRELIERAIGPIWEANHVWLILVIVLLFTAFPPAFAAIANALHVPLLLLLLGIVLRGAAFTFRNYDSRKDQRQRTWGILFSIASLLAPVLLGVIVGALGSGRLTADASNGWVAPWLQRWPLLVGVFTLVLFAYLAAVYLCVEAHEAGSGLEVPFRSRALASWLAAGLLAVFLWFEAKHGAPKIAVGLSQRWFSWPLLGASAVSSLVALHFLVIQKFRAARFAAAAQVSLIVLGWGASQYPWLMVPEMTIQSAAAPAIVLELLLIALAIGSVLLFPSLWYLYRSFKGRHPFSPRDPT